MCGRKCQGVSDQAVSEILRGGGNARLPLGSLAVCKRCARLFGAKGSRKVWESVSTLLAIRVEGTLESLIMEPELSWKGSSQSEFQTHFFLFEDT